MRATDSLEYSKNILARISMCKYVACSAWELLPKPPAHDFFSEFAIEMELGPVCAAYWAHVALSCSSMGSSHGWLWLQDLCPVSPLHRMGIPSDFTITVTICIAEIAGFLSIQSWIKSNSSSVLGGVQEAKKSQSGVKVLLHDSKGQFFPWWASPSLSHTINR